MHTYTHTHTHTHTHTDGLHADLVAGATAVIFASGILLFLITLAATGYHFILKNSTTEKGVPVVGLS